MAGWVVSECSVELVDLLGSGSYGHNNFALPILLFIGIVTLTRCLDPRWFMVFCATSALNTITVLPDVPNNNILALLVNIGIASSIASCLMRRVPRENLLSRSFESYAPVLRCSLLIFYVWVVVHKLNTDFFSAEHTCAFNLYEHTARHLDQISFGLISLPLEPRTAVAGFMLWATIISEAMIPLLLMFRRTRKFGMLFGMLFHVGLALYPAGYVGAFSMTMIALYIPFIPRVVLDRISVAWLHSGIGGWIARHRWSIACIVLGPLLIIMLGGLLKDLARGQEITSLYQSARGLGWPYIFVASVTSVGFLAWNIIRHGRVDWVASSPRRSLHRMGLMTLVPAAVLFNGLAPYLHLKNISVFAMYSNLYVTDTAENHFFLPSFDLMGEGNGEGVRVIRSNDPRVPVTGLVAHEGMEQSPADPFVSRPSWFTLRLLVARTDEDFTITYLRDGGESVTVTRRTHPDDPVFQAPTRLSRTLQGFLDLPPEDQPCKCRH